MAENPLCPRCGNNRQVWHNQITGKLTCHRVGCYIEIIAMDITQPEGAPPALAYQPQHLWSDGEFEMWTNIGEPTISKRVTRDRLTLFKDIHPDAKLRVLKIVSSAEVVDPSSFEPTSAAGIVHGTSCNKWLHDPTHQGYLHSADHDDPYDVDGVAYCGRCHHCIP